MTDSCLLRLPGLFPNLTSLNLWCIWGCYEVTAAGASALPSLKGTLQHLVLASLRPDGWFGYWPKLSVGWQLLLQHLHKLTSLRIDACVVDPQTLAGLGVQLEGWHHQQSSLINLSTVTPIHQAITPIATNLPQLLAQSIQSGPIGPAITNPKS